MNSKSKSNNENVLMEEEVDENENKNGDDHNIIVEEGSNPATPILIDSL